MDMTPGRRLKSQVCETEVIVIRSTETEVTCGGHPLVSDREQARGDLTIDPALADGTLLGKRYVDVSTNLELLVTKPGAGTLAADGVPMTLKAAKPLPASD